MVRILLFGCNGAMGKVISELAKREDKIRIVAGVGLNAKKEYDYPVYSSLAEVEEEADVMVDFSSAGATDTVLDYIQKKKLPLVLATTGLSEEQRKRVESLSRERAILLSSNMSIGINLLHELIAKAASVLAKEGFDMEIVEKHHRYKLDAPSGTALSLAETLRHTLNEDFELVFSRADRREKRSGKEIGISSVRGGSIVGEHDLIFAGEDESITISHQAYSKKIFGKGAIAAAIFLSSKDVGLYSMQDILKRSD